MSAPITLRARRRCPARRLSRPALASAWLLALVVSAGCGDSDLRTVSGSVTFDGAPLPRGHITLLPIDAEGLPASATITAGSYTLQTTPGRKRVQIVADRPTSQRNDVMGAAPREQYLPARYNRASTLEIEVTADGENLFPFDLTGEATAEAQEVPTAGGDASR